MEVGLLSVKDNETTLGDGSWASLDRVPLTGSSILFEQPKEGKFSR